jgi:myo-inositol-1(or 4)-monophosphatase
MNLDNFLATAEKIVREAGLIAKKMSSYPQVLKHKEHGDIVTEGDLSVEEYVLSSLKEQFPNHGFDSEEKGGENIKAEYVWVLDPIDGTKYYAKNIPLYSVSLALEYRGEPVLGVVYSPEFDQMYCAAAGCGAALNGNSINCSSEKHLDNATVCVETPSRDSSKDERQWAIEKMSMVIEHAYRMRIIGVGSLGLCWCAIGGFDAYLNLGCIWKRCDHAAGKVIIQEAGGEFHYFGKQKKQIIAGPASLCNEIRTMINL